MQLRSILVVTIVAVATLGTVFPPALAAANFEITSEDSESVPERPFEFQGTTYQLDSVIPATANDTVNISVSGPDDDYRVVIYNSKEQIVNSRRGTGDEAFTFNLLQYEIGTYALAVYHDGEYEALEPLVVEGYNVSIERPDQFAADENASLQIDVERTTADSSPHKVRAVFAADGNQVLVTATGSDGEYTADIEAGTLEGGDYTVYAIAQGELKAFGRNQVLGMSDRVSLSVENATTTPTQTPTAEPTAMTGQTSESTPTPTWTPTPTLSEPTATATQASAATPTDQPETESAAITPNAAQEEATTSDSGPGFAGIVTLAGIVLAVALLVRRGRE